MKVVYEILVFGIGAMLLRSWVTSAAPVPSPLDPTYNASGPVGGPVGGWSRLPGGGWRHG